jgi:hypothetical protein
MTKKQSHIVDQSIRCLHLHHAFWSKALRFDGLPQGTMFADFSGNNPHAQFAQRAYKVYCSLRERFNREGAVHA